MRTMFPTLQFTTRKGRRAWERFTRGRPRPRTPPRPPKSPVIAPSPPYDPGAGVAHPMSLGKGPNSGLPILGSTATGRGVMQVLANYLVSWGALYAVVKQDLQTEKTRFLASALIAVGVTLVNNVLIPQSAAPDDPMQQVP